MDIAEAIRARKSVRAFRPDPVPREVIEEILKVAVRAPSWENTQPWEIAVISGDKLEELRRRLAEKASSSPPSPEIPRPHFPEPYLSRRRKLGMKIYEIMGIPREDREKRRMWFIRGVRMFEAPCVILIYIDRSVNNTWSIFDCALLVENILLLAVKYGLGTCPQAAPIFYPDVIREVLGLLDSKMPVFSIALGYPDWDHPINQVETEREPIDLITRWYGFGEAKP